MKLITDLQKEENMKREEANKILPILQAFAEGKVIESRCIKRDRLIVDWLFTICSLVLNQFKNSLICKIAISDVAK